MLGVSDSATPDQIRSAYRARMRALHPDNGGDDSGPGRAAISEVVEAWRVLSGHDAPTNMASNAWMPTEDPDGAFDEDDWDDREASPGEWPGVGHEDRMSPRLLRVFFVAATTLVLGWLMIFFVIAWSQSG